MGYKDREKQLAAQRRLMRRLKWVRRGSPALTFQKFLQDWRFNNGERPGEFLYFKAKNLWEGQRELMEAMERQPWILALKAGKLGFSELECAWDGFIARHGPPNSRVHIFSKDGPAAADMLERVRNGLLHLPDPIELLKKHPGGDTTKSLKFQVGEEDIRTVVSFAATRHASINLTCQHAHVDEIAHMPYPRLTWAAINSSVAPDGTCHVLSRGRGFGNYIVSLWDQATNGGVLYPFFAAWTKRPGRDEEWRVKRGQTMPSEELGHFAPASAEEALAGDVRDMYYNIEDVDMMRIGWAGLQPYIPGHKYITAWDIGMAQDATVGITVDYTEKPYQIVAFERLLKAPAPMIQQKIEERRRAYPGTVVMDSTGKGDPVRENLGFWAEPFIFGAKSKYNAIQSLKLLLEKHGIKGAIPALMSELRMYRLDDKKMTQDCVMAMAMAAVHLVAAWFAPVTTPKIRYRIYAE